MVRYMKRGTMGLALMGLVVIGGGFASAEYGQGSATAGDTVTVSYTVVSYRAIELSTDNPVAFGAVRQGGTAEQDGPEILYATTWTGDKIVASIDTATMGGISLYLYATAITEPDPAASACPAGGTGGTLAPVVTMNPTPTAVITGISNCGQAATVTYPTGSTSASPTYSANVAPSPQTWIVAGTHFTLDTAGTTASPSADYTVPVSKTVTFTIKAGA